jgi:hypothetical protein
MQNFKSTLSILLLFGSISCSKLVYANPCLSSDGTFIDFVKNPDIQPIRVYLKKECVYGKLNNHLLVFNVALIDEHSTSSETEQVFEGHFMVEHKAPLMDIDSKIKDVKERSSILGTRNSFDVYTDSSDEKSFSLVSQDERNPVLFICSRTFFCDYITGRRETTVRFRGRFADDFEPVHVNEILSEFIRHTFND